MNIYHGGALVVFFLLGLALYTMAQTIKGVLRENDDLEDINESIRRENASLRESYRIATAVNRKLKEAGCKQE